MATYFVDRFAVCYTVFGYKTKQAHSPMKAVRLFAFILSNRQISRRIKIMPSRSWDGMISF